MLNVIDLDKDGRIRESGDIEKVFFRLSIFSTLVVLLAVGFIFTGEYFVNTSIICLNFLFSLIVFFVINLLISTHYYNNKHKIERLEHLYHCSLRGIVRIPLYMESVDGLQFCIINERLVDTQRIIMRRRSDVVRRNIKWGRIISFWESFFYCLSKH